MKKLFRAKQSKIAGICKGLSRYFNIDESVIRTVFVVLIFLPFPIITIYLLMWLIIPKENNEIKIEKNDKPKIKKLIYTKRTD
jgi:phage shock protein PspC (stress-responsive transcriptional regulator)